jgi:hypothetical protein
MEISGSKKRILFIGLFVVPFLIAMALIFYGKGMGQLPKYYQEESVNKNGEKTKEYYSAPLQSFPDAFNSFQSMSDSASYVICLFPDSLKDRWDKQLLYIERILVQHKGAHVASFFEEDSLGKLLWPTANPQEFIAAQPLWETYKVPQSAWNKLCNDFKIVPKEIKNLYFPPYIILDKRRRIRSMVPLTGLKDVKEITGRLKRLNNEYAAVKKTIEQR